MTGQLWSLLIPSACVVGFAISVTLTPLIRRFAPGWGLVDKPNARKVHLVPTPLGGGLAVFAGVALPLIAGLVAAFALVEMGRIESGGPPRSWVIAAQGVIYRAPQLLTVLLGGLALVVMGLIDDLHNLRWQPKLAIQFLVAGGMVLSGIHLTAFLSLPWAGPVLTILWIVVLTNAFNFLDNMDGLSSGIALIASVNLAVIMLTGTNEPRWFVAGFLCLLAGSLIGFLVHNFPPAKIFMGDAGSCFLGFALATMTVLGTFYDYEQNNKHVLLAPLCILAVPLYDFTSVVLIRLSRGLSPFHADKNHFSHRLVELGFSKKYAVLTIHLVTLTTGLGGLLMYHVPGWAGATLILFMEGCLLAVIAVIETAARRAARARLALEDDPPGTGSVHKPAE